MIETATPTAGARRRTPALAFLLGAGAIAALGALIYFLLAGRAETPATPTEAVLTDEIAGLPAPDGRAITAQVDAALKGAPRDAAQPAEAAASAAQARTAPEPEDMPEVVQPPTLAQGQAAVERDAGPR